eukprot:g79469.t1
MLPRGDGQDGQGVSSPAVAPLCNCLVAPMLPCAIAASPASNSFSGCCIAASTASKFYSGFTPRQGLPREICTKFVRNLGREKLPPRPANFLPAKVAGNLSGICGKWKVWRLSPPQKKRKKIHHFGLSFLLRFV